MSPPSINDDAHERAKHIRATLDILEGRDKYKHTSRRQGKTRAIEPDQSSSSRVAPADSQPLRSQTSWHEPEYSNSDFRKQFKGRLYERYAPIKEAFEDNTSPQDATSLQRRSADGAEQARPDSGLQIPSRAYRERPDYESQSTTLPLYARADLPPRPPSRPLRNSVSRASRRISLTPSELGIAALLGDQARAEALLGLRRHTPPPQSIELDDLATQRAQRLHPILSPQLNDEPLNGSKAWLQACMATLVVFNCWGYSNAFGLFQAYYELYYISQSSPAAIAWIGSTQLALVFGLGVPIGRAVDKGYFKWCFHGGSVLMLITIFCTSFCTSWFALWVVQGVLTGIAMGSIFTSGLVALMSWFDERSMGLAMGLPAAGSCLGGIIYILISRHYLQTQGFAPTMRILSAVALATTTPPNVFFRERRYTRPAKAPRSSRAHSRISLRLFADAAFLLVTAGLFFAFLGLYFGFIYLVSYANTVLHLNATAATNVLIYMLAVNLPGRLIPALISDKCTGPINTMIPATILSAIIICAWAASGNIDQAGLTVIACFYGFVSAGIQSLYASTTYSFCLQPVGNMEPSLVIDRMGLKAGFVFSCIGLAVLIGTPIGGALISYRVDRGLDRPYLGAQVFAAVSLLLGSVFLIAARIKKVGLRLRRA